MAGPPYKDVMGRYLTQALFLECYTGNDRYEPVFTLKEHDYKGLPSIRRLFLECDDPTGYEFAIKYLGSYAHWKELCDCKWFLVELEKWKEEMEIRSRSRAIRKIKEISETDTSAAYQAAKYVAEEGWKGSKRGRPTKAEIEQQKKIEAGIKTEIEDDAERVGLRVVK